MKSSEESTVSPWQEQATFRSEVRLSLVSVEFGVGGGVYGLLSFPCSRGRFMSTRGFRTGLNIVRRRRPASNNSKPLERPVFTKAFVFEGGGCRR